jgi:hypothetical protein
MGSLGMLNWERGRANLEAAQGWFERAVEAGEDAFAVVLGGMFSERGDLVGAQGWFERGAQAGIPAAMTQLGRLLEERDPTAARDWFEQAARAGDTRSNCSATLVGSGYRGGRST